MCHSRSFVCCSFEWTLTDTFYNRTFNESLISVSLAAKMNFNIEILLTSLDTNTQCKWNLQS